MLSPYYIILYYTSSQDNIHVIIDHAKTLKPNVRQAVMNHQSTDGLIAPPVAKYIAEQGLYRDTHKDIESSDIAIQSELFYF